MSTILKNSKFDDDIVPYRAPADGVQLDLQYLKKVQTLEDKIQMQIEQHREEITLQQWFQTYFPQIMIKNLTICKLKQVKQFLDRNNGSWNNGQKTPEEVLENFKESLATKPKLAKIMYDGLRVYRGMQYTKLLQDTILR